MELGKDFYIALLDPSHCTEKFRLKGGENQPLTAFLKHQANDLHSANVGKTYAALQPAPDGSGRDRVIAFITLTCSEIDIRGGYEIGDCAHANRYESMPALKVARLATDARFKGRGIGQQLLELAISLAADHISTTVGCRFLVTDAKQGAVSFYQRQGFTLLETEVNKARSAPVMFLDLNTLLSTEEPLLIQDFFELEIEEPA